MTVARDPTTNLPLSARIAELEAALAAERERREAAEAALREVKVRYKKFPLDSVAVWQMCLAVDNHFHHYED